MNIFKRELKVINRSFLPLFLYPVGVVISGLLFNVNILDISKLYSLYPFYLSLIIPLISSNIWQREVILGLNSYIISSQLSISSVVWSKFLAHYIKVIFSFFLFLPIVFILSLFGNVDFGQVLSINITLLIISFFILSITLLLSTLLKSRTLIIVSTISIATIFLFKSDIFTLEFLGELQLSFILFYLSLSYISLTISVSLISNKLNIFWLIFLLFTLTLSLIIPVSFDLTIDRLSSIDSYIYEVDSKLDENIRIEHYFSEELLTYNEGVKESLILLRRFNNLNNIDILTITDRSDDFLKAVKRFKPIKYNNDELYNFIVVKYKEHYQVIPNIPNTGYLQFEIAKVFKYLIDGGLKKVGLYIGNEEYSEDNFSVLYSKLKEDFNVLYIFPGDSIPHDVDTLVILGQFGINDYYTQEIGHYLAHGGNILFAVNGLKTSNNLQRVDTSILGSLKELGVYPEPYLVADIRGINDYVLNIEAIPNRSLTGNQIVDPFSGFVGVHTSPVHYNNNLYKPLLFSSQLSWLVDSSTGIDGSPESSFPLAVYGEDAISKHFTDDYSEENNRFLVVGSSMSFTDYLYSTNIFSSYEFIRRAIYVLNGDSNFINVRNKRSREVGYYKIESNLYRNSIISSFRILFIFIYPIILFFTQLIINKKAEK